MTVPPRLHPPDWIEPAPGDHPHISAVTEIRWEPAERMPPGVNVMPRIDRRTGDWVLIFREGLPLPVRRKEMHKLRAEMRGAGASRLAAWWIPTAWGMRSLGWSYLRMRAAAAGQDTLAAVTGHAVQFLAGALAVAGVAGGAVYATSGGTPGAPAYGSPAWHRLHPVHVTLPVKPLAYLGAYEATSPASYSGMEAFARTAGRQPNLALYYSGWFERFQTTFAQQAASHGAIPLVQIDPVLYAAPGVTGQGVSLSDIAGGRYDAYLTSYADQVASYGKAVVIGFGHEMNGTWYPWGYRRQPAANFTAAWRHIVDVFRRQGADNVTWLWTVNRDSPHTGPMSWWWPGSSYVTWVGLDGYYQRPDDTWDSVFGPTIAQIRAITKDPLLIAETAIGPVTTEPWQLDDIYASIRQNGYLGLVWFDENKSAYLSYRLEGDPKDSAVFRQLTAAWRLIHQRG